MMSPYCYNYDETTLPTSSKELKPIQSDLIEKNESDIQNSVVITMGLSKDLERHIASAAEDVITAEMTKMVKNRLFQKRYSWTKEPDVISDPLQDWMVDLIKEFLEDNKDLIIEKAAKHLADRMSRSSKVREKFGELLEENANE